MTPLPILLVEDSPDDAELMFAAFESAGVKNPVRHVTDGQQVIDYFTGSGRYSNREEYPLPFLVLLDLKMPLVHGFDVLRWIRQHPEFAPIVVVLSASAHDSDIVTAYRLGANSYVTKPSSLKELTALVASMRSYWMERNQWRPVKGTTRPVTNAAGEE